MAYACESCGGHSPGAARAGRRTCGLCGAVRYPRARPLLVVTGAAGVGKSTVGAAIAARVEGVVALDVDAFGAGAAAARDRDYVAFWSYLLTLTGELHQNDVDVVWCGVCRPEQLSRQADLGAVSGVEMLVLTCADDVYRRRLAARPGGEHMVVRVGFHTALNAELRAARSDEQIRITQLDTTRQSMTETQTAALEWVARATSPR